MQKGCQHAQIKARDGCDVTVESTLIQTSIRTVKINKLFLARFFFASHFSMMKISKWKRKKKKIKNNFHVKKFIELSDDYQENIIVSQMKFPLFILHTMIEIIQLFSLTQEDIHISSD